MKAYEILARRHEESQKVTRYYVEIDVDRVQPAALFRQDFWVNQVHLRKGDILRCVANDGSYDFEMRVHSNKVKDSKATITVSLYPIVPDFIIEAAESGEATKQMATHVNGKPVPRVEQAGADGWRVIGFAGEVVSHGHASQAVATLSMAEYINDAGITTVAEGLAYEAPVVPVLAPPPVGKPPEGWRPGQMSRVKQKEIAKREARQAKQRELDERNKARTAERLAAEAASDAA